MPVDLNLNYTVHYGRTYIVPTKPEREGALRKQIKYKPAYGVFNALNPNRDLDVDFLAGRRFLWRKHKCLGLKC